jgi:large subunit ribosomal protein L31
MKEGLHPKNFRTVIFKDISCDKAWLGKSCAPAKENAEWEDGNSYPLVKIEISNESHPFYTGKMKFVDTAGRIDKFKKKYQK